MLEQLMPGTTSMKTGRLKQVRVTTDLLVMPQILL